MPLSTAVDYRRYFKNISGNLTVTTSTDDTTLVTANSSGKTTIYIQRVIGYVTTDAAQSVSFTDSANTPLKIAELTTSPGDETRWDFDWGEEGVPLTEGKNFLMNVSAVGVALTLKWYGYEKITSAGAA